MNGGGEMQILRRAKILLALVFFIMLVPETTGFAETQIIHGDGSDTNITGLIDYAALADVTAHVQRTNASDTSYYFYNNLQNYVPSNIFDPDTSTFWFGGGDNGDCLIVDLKRQVPIKVLRWKVKERTGSSNTRYYVNLRVSTDGVTYTEAAKIERTAETDGYIDVIYEVPVTARYISYNCYKNNGAGRGEANRIEVYGVPDNSVSVENLLIHDKVENITSSGSYAANSETLAYDGAFRQRNCFVSSETTEKPYIEFTLSEADIITDLLIHPNSTYEESAKNLTVKLSRDGIDWIEAASFSGEHALVQGEFNTIQLEGKNKYKYIRIEKNDSKEVYAVGDLSIAELRVVKNISVEKFTIERTEIVLDENGKVTNVGENASDIKIAMTHDIDVNTINSESVILYANNNATGIQPDIENNMMIFPLKELKGDTDYKLVIKTTLRNTDGIPLNEEIELKFSTGKLYAVDNIEHEKIVNAILNKPVKINPNLGLYNGGSSTNLQEYINDGSVSTGPYLAGGMGDSYYFFDLMNANSVYAIELSERSLGYANDTMGTIVAGSLVMPSINEDGSINVTEMETIYEVTQGLSANETRQIELENIKRYRYIAVYRTNFSSPLCLTEIKVLAQVSLDMKSEPSITYTSSECLVSLDVYSYRNIAFNAYLLLIESDVSGKVVSIIPEGVEIRKGANHISLTHTLQTAENKVRGVLISDDNVPVMLFDGF